MTVVKIIELIGTSPDSWEQATHNAIAKAAETLRGITGAEVIGQTAVVSEGQITEYRVNVKVAFVVEEEVD